MVSHRCEMVGQTYTELSSEVEIETLVTRVKGRPSHLIFVTHNIMEFICWVIEVRWRSRPSHLIFVSHNIMEFICQSQRVKRWDGGAELIIWYLWLTMWTILNISDRRKAITSRPSFTWSSSNGRIDYYNQWAWWAINHFQHQDKSPWPCYASSYNILITYIHVYKSYMIKSQYSLISHSKSTCHAILLHDSSGRKMTLGHTLY